MKPFLIVGTPRSRTAWLAKFLSYGGRECVHEPSLRFSGPECLVRFLKNDDAAAADSMMTFLCRQAKILRPDCIVVSVRRPLTEVRSSFHKLGIIVADWFLEMLDRRVEEIEEEISDISVEFSELEHEDVCESIFEKCLGVDFDRKWWELHKDRNIQSNIRQTIALLKDRDEALGMVFKPYYHA